MSILFINACIRKNSRTLVLAKNVMNDMLGEITELKLNCEDIEALNDRSLKARERLIESGELLDPMFRYARQFAEADEIIIAAPYWDMSFPAKLKIYLEQIAVSGITFKYVAGRPIGLCKAKKLIYVTTSGGPIIYDFGFTYVKALAEKFFGIGKAVAVRAMNLDVEMISAKDLLRKAKISVIE